MPWHQVFIHPDLAYASQKVQAKAEQWLFAFVSCTEHRAAHAACPGLSYPVANRY